MSDPLVIARSPKGEGLVLLPVLANRHGLITGATGTGKTVTLQVLAEGFSGIGVPTFMADVKGDLSGLAAAGAMSPKLGERLSRLGFAEPAWQAAPVVFWDVFGPSGHPVRATISDMGPLLLGRLLNLNETQSGVLTIVFKAADDAGLLLLDLKDLRAMVQFVGERGREITTGYGNVSTGSIGAIKRALLQLEEQGADRFFGGPMLDIADLLQTDADGRGVVNIPSADRLIRSPRVYATGHHRARRRRGARLVPRRARQPAHARAGVDRAARLAYRAGHGRRARGSRGQTGVRPGSDHRASRELDRRSALRFDRAAGRQAGGVAGVGGAERRAIHRLRLRPEPHARHAGVDPGRAAIVPAG